MSGSQPSTRGERTEGLVQVLILLTIGTVAAAASFTHVHNVAAAHGQPGWLAWADAVTLELMSIATGLEIRRRARTGRRAGFVAAVLITAVALSLAAQVVEAEPSVIGWLAAALPALGFLACVKIVMSRTVAHATTATASATSSPVPTPTGIRPFATVPAPAYPSAQTRLVPAHAANAAIPLHVTESHPIETLPDTEITPSAASATLAPPLPSTLLEQARAAVADHQTRTGQPITRDELRMLLRISNATTADVMYALGLNTPTALSTKPVNGTAIPADQTT